MLRQGLRRGCAQLRCAAVAPTLTRQQASILQSIQRPSSITLKSTTRFFSISPRIWDASAAQVVDAEDPVAEKSTTGAPEAITRFDQLDGLVHPALVKNITKGFGYDTMSPVQSATITPALKGMDL